jgi:adenylate cyclase
MTAPSTDWDAEGLLEGLDEPAREARIGLLEELAAAGVPLAQLRAAALDGRLAALPTELAATGPERWTAREAAAEAGIDLDMLLAVRRANGSPVLDPDEPVLNNDDLAAARLGVALLASGVDAGQLLAASRVMARALHQIADAMTSILFDLSYDPNLDEHALAHRLSEQMAVLGPFVGPALEITVQTHMRDALRSAAITAADRSTHGKVAGARGVTIAFADLVGFTRMGEEMPAEDLDNVASRLEELVTDLVRPPVKFVKSIGDAAMLISPESDELLASALDLLDAAEAEATTLPQLRVGVARGMAVHRGGDWFGQPVNLASRITGVARAGSVLASRDVRDDAGAAVTWSRAGHRELRGVPDPVALYRARRALVEDPESDGD